MLCCFGKPHEGQSQARPAAPAVPLLSQQQSQASGLAPQASESIMERPPKRVFSVSLDSCAYLQTAYDYLQGHERLKTKGLFRVSPQKNEVDEMLGAVCAGQRSGFEDINDPHLVAGVIRAFFRELPEPPIPFDLYGEFVRIHEGTIGGDHSGQPDMALAALKTNSLHAHEEETDLRQQHLLALQRFFSAQANFPRINLAVLRALAFFLNRVSAQGGDNLMSPKTLSTVFGPSLVTAKVQSPSVLRDTIKINHLVELMIAEPSQIFVADVHL
jgi:hypothetical protein